MDSISTVNLDGVQTEQTNPRSTNIDTFTTGRLCRMINEEDVTVASKVGECIPIIAGAVDALAGCIRRGGRVIYTGAGTSGRLGVLDASEIPPTYSAPPGQFLGIIAGGDVAIRTAVEGAEDSQDAAVNDLQPLQLGPHDCLIGIAASGRTPYVLSSIAYAKSQGCVTVGLACTKSSAMSVVGNVDYMIEVITGPEVITGSTRMKAGTATKLVLNMLSTGAMIKTGKTYGNTMIDVKPSNAKLRQRARHILRDICGASCPPTDEDLDTVIKVCGGSVKLAAIVLERNVPHEEALRLLDAADGVLSRVLLGPTEEDSGNLSHSLSESATLRYFLCVDGGGSKCEAAIYRENRLEGVGVTGPCNATEAGIRPAVTQICSAIDQALMSCKSNPSEEASWTGFAGVWIAIAGGDRSGIRTNLGEALREKLQIQPNAELRITNDIELLAATNISTTAAKTIIVLVAGTGSVAMAFQRSENGMKRIGRSGGWGPLLGDDGSGFFIGREAIRYCLEDLEASATLSDYWDERPILPNQKSLTKIVLDYYQIRGTGSSPDVLDALLRPGVSHESNTFGTKQRVASCARTIIDASVDCSAAAYIVECAQKCLSNLVKSLLRRQNIHPEDTVLVLSGGLMRSDILCRGLRLQLESAAIQFQDVLLIRAPASDGARYLASRPDRRTEDHGSCT